MTALPIGWFSTGGGPGSRSLLSAVIESIRTGELDAEISVVVCNREPGEHQGSDRFIELVKGYGLPIVCHSSRNFRRASHGDRLWRINYDREVMDQLAGYRPELFMLAGYMLIVSGEMCRRYNMLNLHPSLPGGPVGTWQQVVWKLIGNGAVETGGMVHLVTEELDRGPAATYFSFPIRGKSFDEHWKQVAGRSLDDLQAKEGEELPLFKLIREKGAVRESPLVITTLKALTEGHFNLMNGQVVDSRGDPIPPRCLDEEVNARL